MLVLERRGIHTMLWNMFENGPDKSHLVLLKVHLDLLSEFWSAEDKMIKELACLLKIMRMILFLYP